MAVGGKHDRPTDPHRRLARRGGRSARRARGDPSQPHDGVGLLVSPALSGSEIRLADYADQPMLVVNTASQCGYTPQYAGLQELWTDFKAAA